MECREVFILAYLLTYYVTVGGESDDKVSFTFVIDDTFSMANDIEGVKVAASRICDAVVNSASSTIGNFVFVTFNDPRSEVYVRTITNDPQVLKNALAATTVGSINNFDYPEFALEGMKLGIEKSLPGCFLYVFTDAAAKDYDEYEKVRNLAIKKRCQIVVILTDIYLSDADENIKVYYKLAQSTNGQVFRLEKNSVNAILNYATEMVKEKATVLATKKFPAGEHDFNVSVDSTMKHLIVANSGNQPKVKVSSPEGAPIPCEPLVNLPKVGVDKVLVKEPGSYKITSSATSDMTVVVTAATDVSFKHGFSVITPTSFKDLPVMPLPEEKSHLLIQLKANKEIRLDSIQLLDINENVLVKMPLKVFDDKQKVYITEKFNPPDILFTIKVQGVLVETNEPITSSSTTPIEKQNLALVPKENKLPTIDIVEGQYVLVEYDDALKLECKVNGYPKPDIYWLNEMNEILTKEVITVDVPYDYLSVLEIEKVNKNTTYKCEAKNINGESSYLIKIEAKPKLYFDIIERPKDINIEYKKEKNIQCKVEAYPPATLTWYKGDIELHEDGNFSLSSDGNTLIVKEMKPDLNGPYSCRAKNDFNSTAMFFNILVSGVAPVIVKDDITKINVEYNESTKISCKVSGYPQPEVVWKEIDTNTIVPSHTDISLDSHSDYISNISLNQVIKNTTYQCIAKNLHGTDTKEVQVEAVTHFAVVERPGDEVIEHRTSFQFNCSAEANPSAVVSWLINGSILLTDDNFNVESTSESASTLTIKEMKPLLVGNYSCIIKNHFITQKLNFEVLISDTAPTVFNEVTTPISVDYNNPITLVCNVTGFPAPQIVWLETDTGVRLHTEIIASDDPKYDYKGILESKEAKKNTTYQCLASNSDGEDYSEIQVNVITHFDILLHPEDTHIKHRENAEIKCKVAANPTAVLSWYKNGEILVTDSNNIQIVTLADGTSVLNITKMQPSIPGTYSCKAQNEINMEDMKFEIYITGSAPIVTIDNSPEINAEYEEALPLLCKGRGFPSPEIVFLNEDTGETLTGNPPPPLGLEYDFGERFYIDQVTENATYKCIAKNSFGEHSATVKVVTVKKTYFNIIEQPKDIEIEYEKDGKVMCKVDANPPANIKWYSNTELKNISHISISSDGSVLEFNNMQPNLNGTYSCRAINDENNKAFNFNVLVSGLVRPVIDRSDEYRYINVREGTKADIVCRVISGKPAPTFTWEFSDDKRYEYIYEISDTIHYDAVTRDRTGSYRCIAQNAAGKQTFVVELTVEYPPTIEETEKSKTVKSGDTTLLNCVTSGEPKPDVSWYLNNKLIEKNTKGYVFYSDNSLRFDVSAGNHGIYTCLAENQHGAVNNSIEIKYFVPVDIDIPEDTSFNVTLGKNVELPCIADGYPPPKINWIFFSTKLNNTTPLLLRVAASPDTLVLRSVQYYQDGSYICQVNNGKSEINLGFEVQVHGPPQIVSTNTVRAVKGDAFLKIPCQALGRPKPVIQWIKNGFMIAIGEDIFMADDGSLILREVEDGEFFCNAENEHGVDNKLVEVIVEDFPTPSTPKSTKTLRIGEEAIIKCEIMHTAIDQVRWFKNNKVIGEDKELQLTRVAASDSGIYTCRVSTMSASESRSIRVDVV